MDTRSIARETDRSLPLWNNSWIHSYSFLLSDLTSSTHALHFKNVTDSKCRHNTTLSSGSSHTVMACIVVCCKQWLCGSCYLINNEITHSMMCSDDVTYICILVSSDGNELSLREDKRLSFRGQKGILRSILFHLHDVKTWLVFMERLQHYHLYSKQCNC